MGNNDRNNDRNNERMLPGDYQKWLKEKNKVQNTKKEIKKPRGFFTFPEDIKGNTELPIRPFLVFYFDNNEDYKPSNCKWITHQEQQQNRRAKGYYWSKHAQKWHTKIVVDGEKIHLGYFIKEEDARQAYLDAKKKYHKRSQRKNKEE